MEVFSGTASSESEDLLAGLARKRIGRIPEAQLARHVMAVTDGAEWPVKRAAMEALIRRYGFAVRDGLRVRPGATRQ